MHNFIDPADEHNTKIKLGFRLGLAVQYEPQS